MEFSDLFFTPAHVMDEYFGNWQQPFSLKYVNDSFSPGPISGRKVILVPGVCSSTESAFERRGKTFWEIRQWLIQELGYGYKDIIQ